MLVVAPLDPEIETLAASHPSIEILRAHDVDEALEKLGRNRRIDAVLLAGAAADHSAAILAEIREDNPAPPPVFTTGTGVPGVRALSPGRLEAALDALERELTAEG